MQVVDRFSEGAGVDAFGLQRATHPSQDHLQHRPERHCLFRHQVSELVNMPLGLEHYISSHQEIDAVVRDPVVILVDRPAGRGAPARVHVAGEAAVW